MFAHLLQKQAIFTQPKSIELIRKMGGVSALSEPSRDTELVKILAGHDFSVAMDKVFSANGLEIPNLRIAINQNTGAFISNKTVTKGYNPLQPNELYSLADHLLHLDQSIHITDVVTMDNLIGLQINKGSWSPTGDLADTIKNNILLFTTFDGSKPTSLKTCTFRPACSNQYHRSQQLFSIRHTRNSDVRIAQLKQLLNKVTDEIKTTQDEIQSLVSMAMTNGQATQFFSDLLLDGKTKSELTPRSKTAHDNKVSEFERLLLKGAGADAGRGTRYAAFNALTNWTTHERSTRVSEGANQESVKWESNTFGSSAAFAQNGVARLLKM